MNEFVKIPKRGDIVVGELSTMSVKYISQEAFSQSSLGSGYEVIGVVASVYDTKEVLVVYKNNAPKVWCGRMQYKLKGYALDGAAHSGTLKIRCTPGVTTETTIVVNYQATTKEQLITSINAAFSQEQGAIDYEYIAYIDGEDVKIEWKYTIWQHGSMSATNGFAVEFALLTDIPYANYIRRKNGVSTGNGACSNWDRMAYYGKSKAASLTSPITTYKHAELIGLADYLSDNGAYLRGIFGEGEEGYLEYLKIFLPVIPSGEGNMAKDNAKEITYALYDRKDARGGILCPAFDYAANAATQCLPKGSWYLPSVREVTEILDGVTYGTNPDPNSDGLNKGLGKISGSTRIANWSGYWSAARSAGGSAWSASGSNGFWYSNGMCIGGRAIPVALLKIEL